MAAVVVAGAAAPVPPPPAPPVVLIPSPARNGSIFFAADATEPLVVATPFLGWTNVAAVAGAAHARKELAEWQLVDAFIMKARSAPDLASQAAASTRSILTLQLSAAWWGTYLTELIASGLLRVVLTTRTDLHLAIRELTPVNMNSLMIQAADWAACETFNVPGTPGVPAVAGRPAVAGGRGRRRVAAVPPVPAVPAIPPVPGPDPLVFVNSASLLLLEDTDGGAAPWAAASRAGGMLGAAATRAVRNDPMSNVRRTAALLRAAVARNLGLDAAPANDAPIAGELGNFLRTAYVPTGLEAHGVGGAELSSEAADAFRAQRSKIDLIAVEEKRFHLLQHR